MSGVARKPSRVRTAREAASALADAIDALKSGGLVVYPTETFYGLGADPFSATALARLFAAKQREAGKPVGLIAADAASAFSAAREVPPVARMLADAFWPGPLTIVMPARAGTAAELLGADGGVAVRVSPHPVARALAAGLGHPLTATSANRSGEPPATTLADSRTAFGAEVSVYLEGGRLHAAAPSTVVSVVAAHWRVLRSGAISEREIAAALAPGALR
jgi:L-threonylcarbamoyladenylate synthase